MENGQENNNKIKINTLETCMKYIQQDIQEIKTLIKELKNDFKSKDEEYNAKFATKIELANAQNLNESKKLINNPVIWIIIATTLAALVNIIIAKFNL